MSKGDQHKQDYDIVMDNNGCYSPIDQTDDSETNINQIKILKNIQTQVLSPPNSEPVSSCTVVNSYINSNSCSGSSSFHNQSLYGNYKNKNDNDTEYNKIGEVNNQKVNVDNKKNEKDDKEIKEGNKLDEKNDSKIIVKKSNTKIKESKENNKKDDYGINNRKDIELDKNNKEKDIKTHSQNQNKDKNNIEINNHNKKENNVEKNNEKSKKSSEIKKDVEIKKDNIACFIKEEKFSKENEINIKDKDKQNNENINTSIDSNLLLNNEIKESEDIEMTDVNKENNESDIKEDVEMREVKNEELNINKEEDVEMKDVKEEENVNKVKKENEIEKEHKENEEAKENDNNSNKENISMPPEHIKICTSIVKNLKRHNDSGPFLKPVDPVALGIPDYFTIIHHPMDISTIEKKLKSSSYKNIDEFIDDFSLMFKNCYEYNGIQQPVSLMAKNLEISFNNQLNHYYHEINSSEESSSREIINTTSKDKIHNITDTKNSSTKNNRKTGGKTTNSIYKKRNYNNNSFYSCLYKKSSSRLMKLTGEMVVCTDVLNEILKKRYEHISYPFLQPVDPVALNIPDYPLIIKTPMDISTIQEKLDSGIYLKKKEFEDDFRLIFKNCYQYNPEGTDVYILGKQLEEIFNEYWNYYNDRYEKSLQPPEPVKSNITNHNHNKKSSTANHTNSTSTTTSRKNSHTNSHKVSSQQNTTTTEMKDKIIEDNIEKPIESQITTSNKKNSHSSDHKSQSQQPQPIPNHDHATITPKVSSKSKKRSVSTTIKTTKSKSSKSSTVTQTKQTNHKSSVKKDTKKKGATKVVKKRKLNMIDNEEKEEIIDDFEKAEESDNDEIEELQKTLQTCTARLTMLLEQKSDSLNKKLPPSKKSSAANTNSYTVTSTSHTTKNRRQASHSTTTKKISRNQKNNKLSSKQFKAKHKSNHNFTIDIPKEKYIEEEEEEIEEEIEEEENNNTYSFPSYEDYENPKSRRGVKASLSFNIPSLNMDQKREISDCINKLPLEKMCEVVQIIQESMPLETGQEEIELDIDSFDTTTLWKLYQYVKDNQKKPKKEIRKERVNIKKRIKNEIIDQSDDSSNSLSDSDSDDSFNSSE
ncbi:hypothetical protein H8356DRAFT_1085519 [Neocallimastix lanati (nom. inval.)]|nr:hypothetical protein H8356DRAFT_1085519 [Neocallimastix sp. JGI-2020a]